MVDDDVLLAHRLEAVAVELADALGKAAVERLEQEIGPVGDNELRGICQREEPVLDEHRVLSDLEFLDHELLEAIWHRCLELEPDHVAAAASLQRAFERAHEVLGLFLELELTVAQHAEGALALDLKAGKKLIQEQADHRLHANEAQFGMIGVGPAEADPEPGARAREAGTTQRQH